MMPMGTKRSRRIRLILILIVMGQTQQADELENDPALIDIYSHDDGDDLTPEQLAITDAIDAQYIAYDPTDDPDNFDENSLAPGGGGDGGGDLIIE